MNVQNVSYSEYLQLVFGLICDVGFPSYPNWWFLGSSLKNGVQPRYLSGPFSKRPGAVPRCSVEHLIMAGLEANVFMNLGRLCMTSEEFFVVFVCGWSSPHGPVSLNLMNCCDHGIHLMAQVWNVKGAGAQSYVQIDMLLRTLWCPVISPLSTISITRRVRRLR